MRLSTNPKNIHLNHKSISSVFQVGHGHLLGDFTVVVALSGLKQDFNLTKFLWLPLLLLRLFFSFFSLPRSITN